jgi:hypothetical protein
MLVVVLLFAGALPAQETIRLRSGPALSGTVTEYGENGITLKSSGGKKEYRWEQLDPKCVYEVVRRHMDAASGAAHWALAEYCAAAGMTDEARSEYRRAREIDLTYKPKVEKALIRLESEGTKRKKSLPSPVPAEGAESKESTPPEKAEGTPKSPPKAPPSQEQPADEEKILAVQREGAQKANEELGTKLKTWETKHFFIHSDFTSAADMNTIRKWSEAAYDRLVDVLDVEPDARLWDGKCEIYVFLSHFDFVRFAKTFDNFPEAKLAGGYFAPRGRVCHMVIPKSDRGGKDTFLATLCHELTHAFVRYYISQGNIKPWLNEGLAEYFELALPQGGASYREQRWQLVKRLTEKKDFSRFNELRALKQVLADDQELYALSWSIVEYMISSDKTKKKFGKFVHLLKEGKSEEEAIKEAYGQTPEELEQSWLKYIRARR